MTRHSALVFLLAMMFAASASAAETAIPAGPPAPPVMFEHFPDTLHAYV